MPSHQARRKPLPKDYQFPTPQGLVTSYRFSKSVAGWIDPMGYRLRIYPEVGRTLVRNQDDDEGYGHAV